MSGLILKINVANPMTSKKPPATLGILSMMGRKNFVIIVVENINMGRVPSQKDKSDKKAN